MSDNRPVSAPSGNDLSLSRLAKYVLFGGVGGLLIGVGVLFVVAVLYGTAIGLSPGACAVFACSITMLLSQPAGFAGMVAGAAVGAVAGGIVYHAHHHSQRAM